VKRELSAWGYIWPTLSLGDVNKGTWSYMLGLKARLATLLCEEKKIIVAKMNEVETGCKLEESSKKTGARKGMFC
jgi:hypothetical protein